MKSEKGKTRRRLSIAFRQAVNGVNGVNSSVRHGGQINKPIVQSKRFISYLHIRMNGDCQTAIAAGRFAWRPRGVELLFQLDDRRRC
ncbi:MAG: hypothetical protein LBU43_12645 [Candidatus Accumulibacter sp.]|nr:hypothetical protein [Accumulibacter sp.]